MKCATLVNLQANNGRAARRWARIAQELELSLPPGSRFIAFSPPIDLDERLDTLLADGYQCFISAGGDGSANFLLNSLMKKCGENAQKICLGGIGLGSSNDFIKPKKHFLQGLPTRLNVQTTALVDVGKAEFRTANGGWETRYFMANASLGVTAEANWFFNHGDWFIRLVKDRWTDLAIIYAALRSIFRFKNIPVQLVLPDETLETALSNLAILKSTYVSGSFHFDDPVQRSDGFLGLNACLNMSKMALINTLIALAKGKFKGRPKTLSRAVKTCTVGSATPMALEMDGEVFRTTEVRFSVLPRAIQLMGL